MNISVEWWLYFGVAVLAGGLKLAKDRPNLTEEWGTSIENLAFFLIWPMLSAASVVFWVRIELIGLLDDVVSTETASTLLILRGRLVNITEMLQIGVFVTCGMALLCSGLRWFSQKWNAPFDMALFLRKRGKDPSAYPEIEEAHQDAEQHSKNGSGQRPDV